MGSFALACHYHQTFLEEARLGEAREDFIQGFPWVMLVGRADT